MEKAEVAMIICCGNTKTYAPENLLGYCCKQRLDPNYGFGGGPGIGSYEICWKCGSAYNFRPDMEDSTPEEISAWEAHLAAQPLDHVGQVREGVSYVVTIKEPVCLDGDEEEFMDQRLLED